MRALGPGIAQVDKLQQVLGSFPAFDAGVESVIHRTRATRSGTVAGALLCGAGPSLRMIERPCSS